MLREYENSTKLDEIDKAFNGAECTGQIFMQIIIIATFCVPYFIFISVYLASRQPLLFFCIVLAFVPTIFGTLIRGRVYTKLENVITPVRRKRAYYEKCLADREYFKETRLLGAFWFFRKLHELYLISFSKQSWKYEKKTSFTEIGTRVLTMIGYIGIMLLMFYFLTNGKITPGTFGAVLSSVDMLFGVMEEAFGYGLGWMAEKIGPSFNYFKFMDLNE